jgi:hypothetical protein
MINESNVGIYAMKIIFTGRNLVDENNNTFTLRNLVSPVPTCSEPSRLADKAWTELKSQDFACKPEIEVWTMTFWYGSGSPDPYLWLMDPDPAIFVIDLQDVNKNLFKKK